MVILVKSDDWQGLYINNKLCDEAHHIEFKDIVKACKKNNVRANDLEEVWVTEEYYDNVLSVCGNYPDAYGDVEVE